MDTPLEDLGGDGITRRGVGMPHQCVKLPRTPGRLNTAPGADPAERFAIMPMTWQDKRYRSVRRADAQVATGESFTIDRDHRHPMNRQRFLDRGGNLLRDSSH
ncbi:hypothetical protein ABH920_004633 [Catenulispora sp. EB89]|uniref:hypothetical protein n=1 Tax=Catenulispora sp. EB89 TaxID=3156257 RepID=UPI003512DFFB